MCLYVVFVHSVQHNAPIPKLQATHSQQPTAMVPLDANPFKRTVSRISASIRENIGVREHVLRYVVLHSAGCSSIIRVFVDSPAYRR